MCPLCFNYENEPSQQRFTRYLSVQDSSVILPVPLGLFFEIKVRCNQYFDLNLAYQCLGFCELSIS